MLFPDTLSLEGPRIQLVPLQQVHFPELIAAGSDPKTWQFFNFDGSKPGRLQQFLDESMAAREQGLRHPFAVILKASGKAIGSTSFYDWSERFRNVEIGYTWYHPNTWGQDLNNEAKALMLRHCFETLQLLRVQLKTWEHNYRSRQAMERLGCKLEGFVRNHMIREDGTIRTSALYSLLLEEWPTAWVNNPRYFLADKADATAGGANEQEIE